MPTNTRNPAAAGLRAGLPRRKSFGDDNRLLAQNHAAAQVRLKFLARRLHALGEAPLVHFLNELERGAALRPLLETYAALPADLIRAYRGDRFTPPTFLVKEDGAA